MNRLMNEGWNKSTASLYDDKDLLEKTADCLIVVIVGFQYSPSQLV